MKVMSSKNDELVRETPREKPKRGLAKDYDTHPYPFSDVLLAAAAAVQQYRSTRRV